MRVSLGAYGTYIRTLLQFSHTLFLSDTPSNSVVLPQSKLTRPCRLPQGFSATSASRRGPLY